MHNYTTEQVEFIKTNVVGITSHELTEKFNKHFGLNLGRNQIRSFVRNNKLKNGLNTRFKKGCVPYNKGKKGLGGWEPTQFKKGHKPHNYKTVGTERVNSDDYIDVKIADPNKWRAKHLLIWEKENGPIPKGYAVIFGDKNRRNFDINNLILVSRKQLAILNQHHLIQDNADLTRSAVIVADIYSKINERKSK